MNEYFGVDPATPSEPKELADLCRLFGPSEGRFLMAYPDDWQARLRDHMGQMSDFQKASAVERINNLQHVMLPSPLRARRYDEALGWPENALAIRDHVSRLIGRPDCPPTVQPLRKLLEDPDSFPDVRQAVIPHTVDAYLRVAEPLFLTSTKIALIDRFFKLRQDSGAVDDRRRKVLAAFLKRATEGRRVRVFKLVVPAGTGPIADQYRSDLEALAQEVTGGRIQCELVTLGSALTDPLVSTHARYLLGSHSGLRFDSGFDIDERSPRKSGNDVSWLSKAVLDPLLDKYFDD